MMKRQISDKKTKKILPAAMGVLMAAMLAVPIMGAPLEKDKTVKPSNGDEDFTVTFTTGGEMVSNFTDKDMFAVEGLQPGDTVGFRIKLTNENAKETDWYMLNAVLDSLEGKNKAGGDNANTNTSGGAYEYLLTYQGPADDAPVEIFSSDTVGGDGANASKAPEREGLKGATDNLKDFFWIDRLSANDTAWVELKIKLEGESQGNNYQDTLADLQMRFAVEVPPEPTETTTRPKEQESTRKPAQTNDTLFVSKYLFTGLAALLLLVIVVCGYMTYRKKAAAEGSHMGMGKSDREDRS